MTAIASSQLSAVGSGPTSPGVRRPEAEVGARIRLGFGVLAVVTLVGCGADRVADERRMIAALSGARDRVCTCSDLGCAEAAEQQLADFLLLRVDRLKKIPPPRAGVVDPIATSAAQLDGELRACKQRLEEAARAS